MQKELQREDNDVPLTEMIIKIGEVLKYLVGKWFIILVACILGIAVGLAYAWLKPVKYVSRVSFVVEDSKAGGGGLAALAGQFGFDFGSAGNSGVFSGDNILLFLRSESLCRETLLSNYDANGNETLADRYAEASQMKQKWRKNKKIGEINFSKYRDGNFPRLEDSLMQLVTKKILTRDLSVGKPDKKASFIEVRVATRDEALSKYFSDRLVKIATEKYVESKTRLKALNVAKLQKRADSLGSLLNSRTYSAAASQQNLIDLNPALRMAPVNAEITARDKTMIATIFAEVVKNLEMAKVVLNQETPAIQLVDQSSLPLLREKSSKTVLAAEVGVLFGFVTILLLLVRRWWKRHAGRGGIQGDVGRSVERTDKVVVTKERGVEIGT